MIHRARCSSLQGFTLVIMAALGNALAQDMLREAFVTPAFQRALRPVLAIEVFSAGLRSHGYDTGIHVSAAPRQ